MPDLTRVLTRTCPTNFRWSMEFVSPSSGVPYILSYTDREGYACTCPGFKHRGWCKHVRDDFLTKQRCGGLWGAFANEIYEDEVCPDCGEPTEPFYVGV
jgi:hypothetical protein